LEISGGLAFMFILGCCLIGVVIMIVLYTRQMKTLNFYSYYANSKSDKPVSKIGIFFSFIFEAFFASLVTSLPMALVVYNRNQVFIENGHYNLFHDHHFIVEFMALLGKIFIFYVIAQLCGGFEWTNDGFCRTDKGFNITTDKEEENYEHNIEYKVAAYKKQLEDAATPSIWNMYNVFGKKKVTGTLPSLVSVPIVTAPFAIKNILPRGVAPIPVGGKMNKMKRQRKLSKVSKVSKVAIV